MCVCIYIYVYIYIYIYIYICIYIYNYIHIHIYTSSLILAFDSLRVITEVDYICFIFINIFAHFMELILIALKFWVTSSERLGMLVSPKMSRQVLKDIGFALVTRLE